ncbi:MAG: TonB-dependent receptor [Breznakibacter sp.]|nr:TonB-dependent receptor [Breznakibacter sp.]
MIRTLLLSLFLIITSLGITQNRFSISGTIKDSQTGETLIGAIVQVKELPNIAVITNEYGFYSLNVPAGEYNLSVSFVGYSNYSIPVKANSDVQVGIQLISTTRELEEVSVTAQRSNDNLTKPQMGVEKLNIAQNAKIPVIFGEKDIIKTLQLLPGVKAAGEGSSGFFVRGGSTDGNLILLDEAPVYNASHLLGFFSVFNADAIKDVALYKGTQPAQYGGRLASVLDVKMNDGNSKKFGVSGGIGLIASRLMVEGPLIKKEKGSFMISGRRTYADMFLKLSKDSSYNQTSLYFYDFNTKLNYAFNDKNRLFVSGYFGKDVLGFGDDFGLNWGNATATARFNHIFNPRLFSNTTAIFSNYEYRFFIKFGGNNATVLSRVQDYNFKQDFQYFPNSENSLKFGYNSILHKIKPGEVSISNSESDTNTKLLDKRAWENSLYASHAYKPFAALNIEYGLRLNSFMVLGDGAIYTYDNEGKVAGSTYYEKNEVVENYYTLEPRINVAYVLSPTTSLKAAYSYNSQNIHVISNSTAGNPTDVYLPSSNNVKPELCNLYTVGYFRNFNEDKYEFSTEVYYKQLYNQVDYRDGADLQFNEYLEGELLYGKGRAYGIEFLLRKNAGRFNGWISYTLSRTERKIDQVNQNQWYNARQDRTHDLSVVGIFTINPKWSVSATWIYYTGNAVTFPSGKYAINNQVVNYYTERNGYRMPSYHRLDLSATLISRKTARFESSWNFSIYNLYGKENAYVITFETDENNPSKTQAVQTTLFKFVPAVTYNFKF